LPGGDSKVFEVTIKLFGTDKDLKPAMTTSNAITTEILDNVLFIPLETVHETDSLRYVVVKRGSKWVKQIIEPGPTNENYMVINEGLTDNETLLLSMPDNIDDLEYVGLDIYERQKLRKADKEKQREEFKKEFRKGDRERGDSTRRRRGPRNDGGGMQGGGPPPGGGPR
jgi:HlyD family secretion protein